MELVRLPAGPSLADYGHYAMLHGEVERCGALRGLPATRRPQDLDGQLDQGGRRRAESLPHLIRLLRDLGLTCGCWW